MGDISGVVLDAVTDAPLANVQVVAINRSGTTIALADTDSTGSYFMSRAKL